LALVALGLSDRLNEAPALEGEGGEQRNRGLREERRPEQTGGQGEDGKRSFYAASCLLEREMYWLLLLYGL
jgi:hypothetical protein